MATDSLHKFFLATKTSLAIMALSLLFLTPVQATWSPLNSGTNNTLEAVAFPVNANTGYVVGADGTILKTTDAGANWAKQQSHTRNLLTEVDFIDNMNGYVTGINGTVLKTSDGGQNWINLNTGTSRHLYAVSFPENANIGYVGGDNATLLKTTDGGQTWTPQLIAGGSIRQIVFPQNANVGYASAVWGSLGWVYKTTNGGLTWTLVLDLEDAFLYGMSFPVDDQTGYVANNDTYYQSGIWKTIDGGASWQHVTRSVTAVPYSVDFGIDNQNGIALGSGGSVLKTSDGGASWIEGGTGDNSTLVDLDMIDNNTGYAVGGAGLIYKTIDGGGPTLQITYLHPNAPGSINTFDSIVGCSYDWDCVNDQPGNQASGSPAVANSRDYLADANGHRVMFALDNGVIGNGQRIEKICVSFAATQWYGSYASPSYQRIGIDPAPIDATAFWVNYIYAGIASHCWDNLNWNNSDLDALEIGVKSVNGYALELGQIYVKVFHAAAP